MSGRLARSQFLVAAHMRPDLPQGHCRHHLQTSHQTGLLAVLGRHHQSLDPGISSRDSCCQHRTHRPHPSIEVEFPDHHPVRYPLPVGIRRFGHQYSHRDPEVKPGPSFG